MKQTEEGYSVDCGNHSVWNRQRKVILLTVVKTVYEKDREGSSCSFWRQVYETKKDRPFHSEGRHVYETETEGEKKKKHASCSLWRLVYETGKDRPVHCCNQRVRNRDRTIPWQPDSGRPSRWLWQPECTKQTEKDHVLTMATRVYEADRERSCFDYGNQSVRSRQRKIMFWLWQPECTKQTEKDHVLTMATRVYEADRERSCFDYGNQSVRSRQRKIMFWLWQPECTKQTEKDHVLTMATRVYEADRERSCFDYGNQSVWNRQKRDHPVDYGNHNVRKCLLNFLSCSLCTEHRMVDLLCNSKSELKGSNRLSELVNHQSNLVLSFLFFFFFFFFFRLEIWKGHRRTRNQRTCVKITKPSN